MGESSKNHLFEVIRLVQRECDGYFVIETSGIMIGANPDFLGRPGSEEIENQCRYRTLCVSSLAHKRSSSEGMDALRTEAKRRIELHSFKEAL